MHELSQVYFRVTNIKNKLDKSVVEVFVFVASQSLLDSVCPELVLELSLKQLVLLLLNSGQRQTMLGTEIM